MRGRPKSKKVKFLRQKLDLGLKIIFARRTTLKFESTKVIRGRNSSRWGLMGPMRFRAKKKLVRILPTGKLTDNRPICVMINH